MRCKPGDLAIVISECELGGKLVEVLHAASSGTDFKLPDGHSHAPSRPGSWVVKSLGAPLVARLSNGNTRKSMYGVISDWRLRPLRGESETKDEREAMNAEA